MNSYGWGCGYQWFDGYPSAHVLINGFRFSVFRSANTGWPKATFQRNAWRKSKTPIPT